MFSLLSSSMHIHRPRPLARWGSATACPLLLLSVCLPEAGASRLDVVGEGELLAAVVEGRAATDGDALDDALLGAVIRDALVRQRAVVPHRHLVGQPRDARAELGPRNPLVDKVEDRARLGGLHAVNVRGEGGRREKGAAARARVHRHDRLQHVQLELRQVLAHLHRRCALHGRARVARVAGAVGAVGGVVGVEVEEEVLHGGRERVVRVLR